MKTKVDITISGQGFFSISAASERGQRWLARNVQGVDHGTAFCDDQNMTQDIAEGATADEMRVSVNGYAYLQGGLRGKAVAS